MQSWPLLAAVVASGLIDSFNPCAITVLLLYIALLFSLNKSRKMILAMGFFYIISVYISYLLIGLGVMKLTIFFSTPHFWVMEFKRLFFPKNRADFKNSPRCKTINKQMVI